MPGLTATEHQKAFLDKARKLYSDGKFKAALAAFKEVSSQTCTAAVTNDWLTSSFKALLRCPCTRDVLVQSKKLGLSLKEIQISRCHCKDFESLPIPGSHKLAMYTLAKRPCTCGSDVFHCNVPGHLDALEGVIATYEKLQVPVKARQHATLLIITSPRAPEGYLRLAKALRLCDIEQSPETMARCRWIYRQAIHSVQTHGNKDHQKLKVCQSYCIVHPCTTPTVLMSPIRHMIALLLVRLLVNHTDWLSQVLVSLLRRDIVGSVPAELQTMILEKLGNADLCRSMRVSKTWKRACLDPGVWRHLEFIRSFGAPRRTLRQGVLNNIVSRRARGKAKSLTVWGVGDLGIDLTTLKATLQVLSRLESLSLKGVSGVDDETMRWEEAPLGETWSVMAFVEAPPCLKKLQIAGFYPADASVHWPLPSTFPMAQSLEELCLSQVTSFSVAPKLLCSTVWPKLRKLTMLSLSRAGPMQVDLVRSFNPILVVQALILLQDRLVHATPSLKDLRIRCLDARATGSTPSWESLEQLELGMDFQNYNLALHPMLGTNVLLAPPAPLVSVPQLRPTIRSLKFPGRALSVLDVYEEIAQAYSGTVNNNVTLPPVSELARLEHLYLRDTDHLFAHGVHDVEALGWFMDLIEPSMSNGTLTSLAVTFCPEVRFELDRVLNKDAIRTLSCYDFIDEEYASYCGDTFADWVQGFHNVTTLGVFPQKSDSCWMHVSKVLKKESSIETIYTDILVGQPRDWVLAKAKEKGVTIIETSHVPEPVLQPLKTE